MILNLWSLSGKFPQFQRPSKTIDLLLTSSSIVVRLIHIFFRTLRIFCMVTKMMRLVYHHFKVLLHLFESGIALSSWTMAMGRGLLLLVFRASSKCLMILRFKLPLTLRLILMQIRTPSRAVRRMRRICDDRNRFNRRTYDRDGKRYGYCRHSRCVRRSHPRNQRWDIH